MSSNHEDFTNLPEAAEKWAKIAEKSNRVVQAFWERQAKEADPGEFHLIDPMSVAKAFGEFTAHVMSDPARLIEAQTDFMRQSMALWEQTWRRMQGGDGEDDAGGQRRDHDGRGDHGGADFLDGVHGIPPYKVCAVGGLDGHDACCGSNRSRVSRHLRPVVHAS